LKAEPIRELDIKFDDNGQPSWCSSPSPKDVKVRGACDLPPHLPGLIIFVHGVNSTGEWYQKAEASLCEGLNERLGLKGTGFDLKANNYSNDEQVVKDDSGKEVIVPSSPLLERKLVSTHDRSPVIRFFWGYASPKNQEGKYKIPLVNIKGDDYHQMKLNNVDDEVIKSKGPYFWGGGPFQNGTNNLYSLWSEFGFDENLAGLPGVKVQYANEDVDRILTNAPPRKYYAHAAKRLADLIDLIREKYPKDTVSIISHSQGTMISLAAVALAKKAPDALFVLNSPYAMHNGFLNEVSLPASERITPSGREETLSEIIDKVGRQTSHLISLGLDGLCVGKSHDNRNWRPDGELKVGDVSLPERDNHGRTYIYFCPHDRVMGSRPLRSIGWEGLPNDKNGNPHPLLSKHKGKLFQRILARSTVCGSEPNVSTPFGTLPDGKPFWDDTGDKYQSSSTTYPDPPKWQTVFINAERVPKPISANEMASFDESRVGKEHGKEQRDGWGEINPLTGRKNDNTYDNYINLYTDKDIVIGFKDGVNNNKIPITRKEFFNEKDERLRTYVSQPTDHSTLPGSGKFMSQAVAYDLPIGFCDATWDKEFMAKLRDMADWTKGYDSYFETGVFPEVEIPSIISTETSASIETARKEALKKAGEEATKNFMDHVMPQSSKSLDKYQDIETLYQSGMNGNFPVNKK
jgi:hypothetical protein